MKNEEEKQEALVKAKEVQSRVLNYAILTELRLQDFIRDYFIDKKKKKEKFEELIVSKEFFTFAQKIRIFEKIIEEYANLKIAVIPKGEYKLGDYKKELMKKIKLIQEIRNQIAHKHPFRDKDTDEITIKYKFDGKSKEIVLNDSFVTKLFKDYMEVFFVLRDLSKKIFKKR